MNLSFKNTNLAIAAAFFALSITAISNSQVSPKYIPPRNYTLQTIWELPNIPESEIDIGLWALIIAKEYDSTIEINRYLGTLDSMANQIQFMIGNRDLDIVKLVMIKMYLYDTGSWNQSHIFSYDFNDPLGQKPDAMLLTTYIDSHKGNCVNMPILFLALMERVDSDVLCAGVCAPLHLFCRMRDRQTNKDWNVETTSKGNSADDEWYIENFKISKLTLDSGIYMIDLTKKQVLAELMGTLVIKYRSNQNYEQALKYAELMLKLNPKSVTALVQKGALLGWLGHNLQQRIQKEGRSPTPEEDKKLTLYEQESIFYIARAKALGWEPETPESKAEYLQTVKKAKAGN